MNHQKAQEILFNLYKQAHTVDSEVTHPHDTVEHVNTGIGVHLKNVTEDKYRKDMQDKQLNVAGQLNKKADDDGDVFGSTDAVLQIVKDFHSIPDSVKYGLPIKSAEKEMEGPDPCWEGYEMIGKKKKNGKEVPNCVPTKKASLEMPITDNNNPEKIKKFIGWLKNQYNKLNQKPEEKSKFSYASNEIIGMVKTAVLEDNNFNRIAKVLNEMGYTPEIILKTFNEL
jgi:hypothetical protein